jgi:Rieske Fe-S protein
MSEGPKRREFVAGSVAALGIVACGGNKASVTPEAGVVTLTLKDYPALSADGGFVGLEVAGAEPPDVIVFHRSDGSYGATSRKCTHAGCKVKFDVEADEIACPCHGSRFSPDGFPLHGPAKKPLTPYRVDAAEGLLKIRVG